ncbi:hypothetical protein K491DRAFT_714858 [Lophiostoma macrostomum CBS 122681]|uniref:Uncharacterized protein n=1 Tax=Lophiostoma macrostomum CBS 122681 TaxID=1314788 RepID=A0A6A6TB06_9PLEO|nr:hypothetical protein K491DRAFT_714858 [Lophiostoma macrostomum CBS 122681]
MAAPPRAPPRGDNWALGVEVKDLWARLWWRGADIPMPMTVAELAHMSLRSQLLCGAAVMVVGLGFNSVVIWCRWRAGLEE